METVLTPKKTKDSQINYATFWDHFEELRKTAIKIFLIIGIGFILAAIFYQPIFQLLAWPLNTQKLVLLSPSEGIRCILKTSFWIGTVGTSPIWLYYIINFIAPALNQYQRNFIPLFFFISLLFLAIGFSFAFFVTIPLANSYLGLLNQEFGENLWTLSNYLDYTITLLFANGLAFEFMVILFFLVHFGVILSKNMAESRRYVIVAIFILSAILTPPDILTQFMLALPLMGLYELAILYARFIVRP
jgi:sec-independent protein translocase protein TatC